MGSCHSQHAQVAVEACTPSASLKVTADLPFSGSHSKDRKSSTLRRSLMNAECGKKAARDSGLVSSQKRTVPHSATGPVLGPQGKGAPAWSTKTGPVQRTQSIGSLPKDDPARTMQSTSFFEQMTSHCSSLLKEKKAAPQRNVAMSQELRSLLDEVYARHCGSDVQLFEELTLSYALEKTRERESLLHRRLFRTCGARPVSVNVQVKYEDSSPSPSPKWHANDNGGDESEPLQGKVPSTMPNTNNSNAAHHNEGVIGAELPSVPQGDDCGGEGTICSVCRQSMLSPRKGVATGSQGSHRSSNTSSTLGSLLLGSSPAVHALRSIFDTILEAVVVASEDGIIEMANATALEMLSFRLPSDLIGRSIDTIIEPKHRKFHAHYMKSYNVTGVKKIIGTRGREVNATSANGELIPILLSVGECRLDSSRVVASQGSERRHPAPKRQRFFVAVFHDLRERKRLEQAEKARYDADAEKHAMRKFLQCTSHDLRTPLQAAQHAVQAINDELSLLMAEATDAEATDNNDKLKVKSTRIDPIAEDTETLWSASVIQSTVEGESVPSDDSLSRAPSRKPRKGSFFDHVKQLREMSSIISSSMMLADLIISNVLDIQKIQSNNLEVVRNNVDLKRKLKDMLRVIRSSTIGKEGVELVDKVSDHMPSAICDYSKILRVVMNLITNALKFTTAGSVTVTVRPHEIVAGHRAFRRATTSSSKSPAQVTLPNGRKVPSLRASVTSSLAEDGGGQTRLYTFSVEDTGKGMTEEQVANATKPYVKASASDGGGMGLGLYIAEETVRALGGQLKIESKLGVGTKIQFTIPLTVPFEQSTPSSPYRTQQKRIAALTGKSLAPARPLRILFVEDVPLNRKLGVALLRSLGHIVVPAENGKVALDLLKETLENNLRIERTFGCEDILHDNTGGGSERRVSEGASCIEGSEGTSRPSTSGRRWRGLSRSPSPAPSPCCENAGNAFLCCTSKRAIPAFPDPPFDLAFFDHFMPVMDGIEAVRLYRAFEASQADLMEINDIATLRICALTADVSTETQKEFVQTGCDDFLPKPFSKDDLAQYLSRVTTNL